MDKTEVILLGGQRIYLDKGSIITGDRGLQGYNSEEEKHYMIPLHAILFVRSGEKLG